MEPASTATKDDRSHEVQAVAILFLALTWLTVSLRVYVRGIMLKTWGGDDWWMAAALLVFTVYIAFELVGTVYGTGRHRWDLTDEDARIALMFWYLGELLYVISTCCLKLALGIFYIRVAAKPWHLRCIWLLMAGTVLFGLVYLFLVMFQCLPVSEFWNNHPASDKCLARGPTLGITYAIGALNAFADWGFGILPFFVVWDLQMNIKTKIMVACILAFAAIGSTATIVRMQYLRYLSDDNGRDFLWVTTDVAIWSTVEPGIGITAGSMATLRPLLQKVLRQLGLSTSASTAAHYRPSDSSRKNYKRGYRRSIGLDDLVPSQDGNHSITVSGPTHPANARIHEGDHGTERSIDSRDRNVVYNDEVSTSTSHGDFRVCKSIVVESEKVPPRLSLRDSIRHSLMRGTSLSSMNAGDS